MNSKGLINRLTRSSVSIRIATLAVLVVWGMVLIALLAITFLLLEQPTHTLPPTPGGTIPKITLEPAAGPPGATVRVKGEGWVPGSMVFIYLKAPGETELPSYAVAGFNADAMGRFTTGFVVPSGPGWENQGLATVVAQVAEGGAAAQAFFSVVRVPEQPTATPLVSVEPTATPTEESSPTPTPTPEAKPPTATANTDLNIRGGPGVNYPILGVLRAGQSAEITGKSADGGWWQIYFTGAPDGRGWVSAYYVNAQNADNVPVVQPSAAPATATPKPPPPPTPTPTSVVITDWRGEYYSNRDLNGHPALVRNDVAINFDWGDGPPGPGLPADDFSVRWSRGLSYSAGTYRFYVRVDDGARLWVDGNLVIDEWHDSAPTTYSADVNLGDGWHTLRMDYYERSGGALAQLAWEHLEGYPDWKAEYYDNRKLDGDPVLVRNETDIDHSWGDGSPGSGVPADNFSARWTRKIKFEDGTYKFRARVDDGVRLWVGDSLVLDSWQDGSSRWVEAEREINEDKHRVKVEYYEHRGDARIEVTWKRVEEPSNQRPQAVPGGPYTVDEGSAVTLDGRRSKDPDGRIVKYEWDLSYNGSTFVVDATGREVSTSYADGPATIKVALRVTDDEGARHTATTRVQVENVAPSVEAGGPYAGRVGELISMAGTATDPGSIDQAGLIYDWAFGDGAEGKGPIVSHSYAQPGDYQVTLTVSDKDGGQGADTATVSVTLEPINHAPVANDDSATTDEDIAVSVAVLANDTDPDDDPLTVTNLTLPTNGAVSLNQDNTVTYTPNSGFTGADSFTYTANDGLLDSNVATVNVTVEPVNHAPVANNDGATTDENTPVSVAVLANDADPDDDPLTVTNLAQPANGAVSLNQDNTVTYTPNPGFTGADSFTYTANDGLLDSNVATVSVMVEPLNHSPVASFTYMCTALTCDFDASGSYDPDGSIGYYDWDFGDGSIGSGVNVSHVYGQAGSYQVTLMVTDDGGMTGETTLPIELPVSALTMQVDFSVR